MVLHKKMQCMSNSYRSSIERRRREENKSEHRLCISISIMYTSMARYIDIDIDIDLSRYRYIVSERQFHRRIMVECRIEVACKNPYCH